MTWWVVTLSVSGAPPSMSASMVRAKLCWAFCTRSGVVEALMLTCLG